MNKRPNSEGAAYFLFQAGTFDLVPQEFSIEVVGGELNAKCSVCRARCVTRTATPWTRPLTREKSVARRPPPASSRKAAGVGARPTRTRPSPPRRPRPAPPLAPRPPPPRTPAAPPPAPRGRCAALPLLRRSLLRRPPSTSATMTTTTTAAAQRHRKRASSSARRCSRGQPPPKNVLFGSEQEGQDLLRGRRPPRPGRAERLSGHARFLQVCADRRATAIRCRPFAGRLAHSRGRRVRRSPSDHSGGNKTSFK